MGRESATDLGNLKKGKKKESTRAILAGSKFMTDLSASVPGIHGSLPPSPLLGSPYFSSFKALQEHLLRNAVPLLSPSNEYMTLQVAVIEWYRGGTPTGSYVNCLNFRCFFSSLWPYQAVDFTGARSTVYMRNAAYSTTQCIHKCTLLKQSKGYVPSVNKFLSLSLALDICYELCFGSVRAFVSSRESVSDIMNTSAASLRGRGCVRLVCSFRFHDERMSVYNDRVFYCSIQLFSSF